MSQPPIIHERCEGYHVVTLNRPDRLNAFNQEQHRALRAALEAAEADDGCGAIILTGAGRAFCAGQDLTERRQASSGEAPDLGLSLDTWYNPLVRKLRALEMPVICAVNGVAAGAGANIALACDIVLAARSARFIQAFAKIGLIPDAGGTYWLTRHLGEARAKALAMTGHPLSAEDAAQWGLIWKAVEDERLMEEARGLAQTLADGPRKAHALTRRAIQAATTSSLDEQLDLESTLQREAGQSDEYRKGIAAFLQKRSRGAS